MGTTITGNTAGKYSLMPIFFIVLSILCLGFRSLCAGEPEIIMTPTELMLAPEEEFIVAAAKVKQKLSEAPGIVTVITGDEIVNMGARDLIDVLRIVPGIFFGLDGEGIVSLGIRGMWAHEGKILLLVDGQEYNEILFTTQYYGNNFPVEQIDRIEIIRGPGSALYGGSAQLGVISIITKNGGEIDGLSSTLTLGQFEDAYARRNINLSYGRAFDDDLDIAVSVFAGQGQRSNLDYTDAKGETYNMKDNSNLNPNNVNVGIGYKGLGVRLILDEYRITQRSDWGISLKKPINEEFNSYLAEVKYDCKIGEKMKLTPKFNYKRQLPWRARAIEENYVFDITAERRTGNLTLSYDATQKINIIAGVEGYIDNARISDDTPRYYNGGKTCEYTNQAAFVQCLGNFPAANFVVGTRYERHSQYGESSVPRFAVTKLMDKMHLKLLYSHSFRAPSIQAIATAQKRNKVIVPERAEVSECELGYQLTDKMSVTANVFDIYVKQPLVYMADPESAEGWYENFGMIRTQGFESVYKFKSSWGYASLTYSFYRVVENKVETYKVPGDETVLLGAPSHKLTLNGSVRITDEFSFNPSAVYVSNSYGYAYDGASGGLALKKFDPAAFFNISLLYKNVIGKGSALSINVHDLFGSNERFIQPYDGGHPPLPGPSREFGIRVQYKI